MKSSLLHPSTPSRPQAGTVTTETIEFAVPAELAPQHRPRRGESVSSRRGTSPHRQSCRPIVRRPAEHCPAGDTRREKGDLRQFDLGVTKRRSSEHRLSEHRVSGRRPADRRPESPVGGRVRVVGGAVCAHPVSGEGVGRVRRGSDVHRRRRATAVAVMVGAALALTVWIIGIIGTGYQEAATPAPVSTEVVHVRSGDSLSSIASRVAPDMPVETVIEEIVDLNDISASGLHVGQPLLTPTYR